MSTGGMISARDGSREGRSWERRTEELWLGAPSDLWLQCWGACARGDDAEGLRVFERLMRHDCVLQACELANAAGNTLLHQAASGNCIMTLRALLAREETHVNKINKGSSAALHWVNKCLPTTQ